MLYRFKSKATGDTLMLQPQAEQFLRALGREPAARGIIETADMAAALQDLQQAIVADEQDRSGRDVADEAAAVAASEATGPTGRDPVPLRRRLWPMVQMIERAQAAGEPVVWGV